MTEKIPVYRLGTLLSFRWNQKGLEKKLLFSFFPHSADDVLNTSLIILGSAIILSVILSFISSFLAMALFFLALIAAIITYIYPGHVFYTHALMQYREEMLRSILHLGTYIQTDSSMEYAIEHTQDVLTGALGQQFRMITKSLKRKRATNLAEALEPYMPIWKEHNPHYVKAMRLLQIASLSGKDDRERIIGETIETMMTAYMVLAKRSAEELSKNTSMLLGAGILLPIMSLLVLPILAVFMPSLVQPAYLAFIYIVLFPTIVFVASLSFASKRVQVDTINMRDSEDYTPIGRMPLLIAIGIAVLFAVPAFPIISEVVADPANTLDRFSYFLVAWLVGLGMAAGTYVYAMIFERHHRKVWNSVRTIEEDLPFILQSFSTYFTLNRPFESVITDVIEDYQSLGFYDHPAVNAFKTIKKKLITAKQSIQHVIESSLKHIIPSRKVRQVIRQIVAYEHVSQESAAKASRMIREQLQNTYRVDDYIKTLLSDTVGLIRITVTMLAPLLCAAAVVMTYAILKSTVFITQQLAAITEAFGGEALELNLINVESVISPIFIGMIVGVYLLQMILVLSVFQTQIGTGSDLYETMRNIKTNVTSYILYSALLLGGYYAVNTFLFGSILA